MEKEQNPEQNHIVANSNKVALVTGSLSGIGLAIAHSFASKGYNVILNGFASEETIKSTIHQFQTKYPKTTPFYIFADLTKAVDCKKLVEQTINKFGKIDVLVNNAGILHAADCVGLLQDHWQQMMALNLSAPFYLCKYALPYMQKLNWGRIINISSVSGLVGSANLSGYVASKHGLVGLTKAIALQNAKKGITCNAVCPGFVLTPMFQKVIETFAERHNLSREQATKNLAQIQPSGQFITPEEVAEMVAYLASDKAGQINGAALTIDGCLTAQ